jgi:hypothetical protein
MIDFHTLQLGELVYFAKDVCLPDLRPGEYGIDKDVPAGTLARVIGKNPVDSFATPRSIKVLILTDELLEIRDKQKKYEKLSRFLMARGEEIDLSYLDASIASAPEGQEGKACVNFFRSCADLCDPEDAEKLRGQYISWDCLKKVTSDEGLKKLLGLP